MHLVVATSIVPFSKGTIAGGNCWGLGQGVLRIPILNIGVRLVFQFFPRHKGWLDWVRHHQQPGLRTPCNGLLSKCLTRWSYLQGILPVHSSCHPIPTFQLARNLLHTSPHFLLTKIATLRLWCILPWLPWSSRCLHEETTNIPGLFFFDDPHALSASPLVCNFSSAQDQSEALPKMRTEIWTVLARCVLNMTLTSGWAIFFFFFWVIFSYNQVHYPVWTLDFYHCTVFVHYCWGFMYRTHLQPPSSPVDSCMEAGRRCRGRF